MNDDYNDIINLNRPISLVHKPMSLESRSAQFAPFAALTGYGEQVKEKARLTDKKIELDEESLLILNNKLQQLITNIHSKPKVAIRYFIKDDKKSGGRYETIIDNVRRIDSVAQIIYLITTKININMIINIEIL